MLLLFDSIKLFNKLALVTPVPYRTGIWLFVHDWFYGRIKLSVVKHPYLFKSCARNQSITFINM